MDEPLPSLGELEIQVMRLVWREQPCSERQVTDLLLAERPVVRTTVLKTMQRLEEKGLLARVPGDGPGPVRYRATREERRVLPALIRRFVEKVLGGSPGPLAAFLAESDGGKLSDEDLAALRAIARKMGDGPDGPA